MKYEQSNNCIVYTLDKPVTSHHCVYTNGYAYGIDTIGQWRPVEHIRNDSINDNVTEVRRTIVKRITPLQTGGLLKQPQPSPPPQR